LAQVEPQHGKAGAGATQKPSEADMKAKILEHSFWLLKEGYKESTIHERTSIFKTLVKRGANLLDPESVKEVIAKQKTWCEGRKGLVVDVYTTFLRSLGLRWDPPRYGNPQKLPYIPTEAEIDQLIAACRRKLGTFLQLLKETGMRPGEAWNLLWTDLDSARRIVAVNDPEKGSNARMLRISEQLVTRLNMLPKKSQHIFREEGKLLRTWTSSFRDRRKKLAEKLNNPRILKISFKTLRHFKGTIEYHKTKDILHVKELLGHKSIENTLIYIHLEAAIFQTANDEFIVKAANTLEEATKLLEVGFEYVTDMDGFKLFRKRK